MSAQRFLICVLYALLFYFFVCLSQKKASPQAGFLYFLQLSAWLQRPERQRRRAWQRQRPERQRQQPGRPEPEQQRQQPGRPERERVLQRREQEPEPGSRRACCKRQQTARGARQRGASASFLIPFIDKEYAEKSFQTGDEPVSRKLYQSIFRKALMIE